MFCWRQTAKSVLTCSVAAVKEYNCAACWKTHHSPCSAPFPSANDPFIEPIRVEGVNKTTQTDRCTRGKWAEPRQVQTHLMICTAPWDKGPVVAEAASSPLPTALLGAWEFDNAVWLAEEEPIGALLFLMLSRPRTLTGVRKQKGCTVCL